jgi:3',5'-cyclic AMP phosphodiesterase CpdA
MGLSVAVTADLHWGHNPAGDAATRLLVDWLQSRPPDVLILAGDLGTGQRFAECLRLFAALPSRKALVPGNHDVWVPRDAAFDSLHLYDVELPRQSQEHGFEYLDRGPLLLPEADLAVVGAMNWYDYSWGLEALRQHYPGEEWRLRQKRLLMGQHMDAVFVRWAHDDESFTTRTAATLEQHLHDALSSASRALVVTHHPPFRAISFPSTGQVDQLDRVLWAALGGNARVEELLQRHAARIPFVFCGHTHRERQGQLGGMQGFNVGSDYHFKHLLWLQLPEGTIEGFTFGNQERPARE